jgi:site-specific recombinase XerD
MLDLHDFGPNPHVPAYGEFGAVTIRWAKGTAGTAGSGPRRRTVLTVPESEWVVDLLKFWIHEGGRDRFPMADRSAALWPSERADRITLGSLGDSFAAARDAVGLPKELGLHCLRHSYITHLKVLATTPAFVQTQAGHAYASVTSVYTSVGDDFKQKTIQKMIARRIARPEEANPDG